MIRQIIFCVEGDTDWMYIQPTIIKLYGNPVSIRLSHIVMKGKGNYRDKSVLNKIAKEKRPFSDSENIVIYCFDTDNADSDRQERMFMVEAEKFCRKQGFSIIYFSHDIEDVFLGHTVSSEKKKEQARKFFISGKVEVRSLCTEKESLTRHKSNMCLVLDKCLERK